MADSLCFRALARTSSCLLALCILAMAAVAQPPVLAPTGNTTIVVPAGVLHYSSIHIPAGVTVRFLAPGLYVNSIPGMPAVLLCDGHAIVHGTLSVAGNNTNEYAAGWVTTGEGSPGNLCGGNYSTIPQGGSHAGTYGSVVPFSLEGGSFGGLLFEFADPGCWQPLRITSGGQGGGTLVLHARGRIEVHGTVTADGRHNGVSGGGSGGSILLRGDAGVRVLSGGAVSARGGTSSTPPPETNGDSGYVRLDAWGAPPVIQGTVDPPPAVIELPHLRTQSPPQIGTTWTLDVLAPENAPVFLAVSLRPAPGTPTPFGPLGIDLVVAAGLASTVAPPGHDPIASVPLAVPPSSALVGLNVWVQGLAIPPSLPARLTNTIAAVVQ